MKSYVRKIKSLEKKVHTKALKLSEIEREYKYLRKEYQDYCSMEVTRRYKIGQILVYEINEEYRKYTKIIFAFGGVDRCSVEKYGRFNLVSGCYCEHGNVPICSACEYEHIRLATTDEIKEFKTAIIERGLKSDQDFYKEILDEC